MDWIIALIAGAVIGWLAGLIMKTDAQQGCVWNVVIGVVGALIGRYLGKILEVESAADAGRFSVTGIIWGVIGAIIFIVILRALRVLK